MSDWMRQSLGERKGLGERVTLTEAEEDRLLVDEECPVCGTALSRFVVMELDAGAIYAECPSCKVSYRNDIV